MEGFSDEATSSFLFPFIEGAAKIIPQGYQYVIYLLISLHNIPHFTCKIVPILKKEVIGK